MSGQDICVFVFGVVMVFAVIFNSTMLPKLLDKKNNENKKGEK